MKRIFRHPPEPATGRKYWRSLEEFADTPEFREKLAREFPRGAAELEGDELSRRSFMKFMGASVALAGLSLTGCRRPLLHGVPYSKGIEWQVPGNALHYATSMPRRGGALPLIATTYNGRPTKLDGNPNVPGLNGATDIFGQAAILDLYDPDRSQVVLKVSSALNAVAEPSAKVTQEDALRMNATAAVATAQRGKDYVEASIDDFWEELAIVRHAYQQNGGDGLAILAEPCSSPTRHRLRVELQRQFPKLVWAEYEPWTHQAGGDFSKADVIVSLDCDFLGASDGTPQSIAGFAAGRRKLGKTQETMSRLYCIEGRLSLTGSMADHRAARTKQQHRRHRHAAGVQARWAACPPATVSRRLTIPRSTPGSRPWPPICKRPVPGRWSFAGASSPQPFTRRSRRSIRRSEAPRRSTPAALLAAP